jgi:hypothetical protein
LPWPAINRAHAIRADEAEGGECKRLARAGESNSIDSTMLSAILSAMLCQIDHMPPACMRTGSEFGQKHSAWKTISNMAD